MNEIVVTRQDEILTVTLNRPEKRNALTSGMLHHLVELFQGMENDAARVVVVRGEGSSFSAGLDLAEMQRARDAKGGVALTEIEDVFQALEQMPQATLAMVQGDAIAGGCELALHCDLRVAAEDVRFSMPLAKLGLVLPFPLIQKLLDSVGTAATKELLFTGNRFEAARAAALGMVSRVVPRAELENTTYDLARAIAGNAPLAVRAMKRAIFRANDFRRSIDWQDLAAEAAKVGASDDVREGVAAMRERRPPRFQGR